MWYASRRNFSYSGYQNYPTSSHTFFSHLYSKSYGSRIFIYLYHKVSSICMISFSSIGQTVHFLLKKKIITYNFSSSKIIQQVTFWDRKLITDFFLSGPNRFIASSIRVKYVWLHFKVLTSVA